MPGLDYLPPDAGNLMEQLKRASTMCIAKQDTFELGIRLHVHLLACVTGPA